MNTDVALEAFVYAVAFVGILWSLLWLRWRFMVKPYRDEALKRRASQPPDDR